MVDATVRDKDSNKLSGPVFSEKACCLKLPSNVLTSYDLLCTVWDPDLQSWLETCLGFGLNTLRMWVRWCGSFVLSMLPQDR
jgi:hypothetical protein